MDSDDVVASCNCPCGSHSRVNTALHCCQNLQLFHSILPVYRCEFAVRIDDICAAIPASAAARYIPGSAAITASISCCVVVCPRENRWVDRAAASSWPVARITCDGRDTPALHAEPVEDSIPAMSNPNSNESPSASAKEKCTFVGSRYFGLLGPWSFASGMAAWKIGRAHV